MAFNGETVETTLRAMKLYMRTKDADERHPKDMLHDAVERHRDLRHLILWMAADHPDRAHVLAVAQTMQDLAAGLTKILWPAVR